MKLRTVEVGSEFTNKILSNTEMESFKKFYDSDLYKILLKTELVQSVVIVGKNVVQAKTIYSPAPCEWTFGMMLDAAICILKIQKASKNYGFQLEDAHFQNVVFDGSKPVFVDLGSFKKVDASIRWAASGEYRTEIKIPLKLVSNGFGSIVRKSLEHDTQLSREGLWRIRFPFIGMIIHLTRLNNFFVLQRERLALVGIFNLPNAVLHASNSTISDLRHNLPRKIATKNVFVYILSWLSKLLGPILEIRPSSEIRKLEKKRKRFRSNYWTNYYSELNHPGTMSDIERFNSIAEKISGLQIRSVTDLGGNNGLFVKRLIDRSLIERGVVIDGDEGAIDAARLILQDLVGMYSLGLVDLSEPLRPQNWMQDRFTSDCAVALAITHHLTLRYRLTFEQTMTMISTYSRKHVFIEFMPLGLWDGANSPVNPDWYTEKNFTSAFESHFRLIERVDLKENRILFIGEKKSSSK